MFCPLPYCLLLTAALAPCLAAAAANPLVGRWDFDVPAPHGIGANWLEVKEQSGKVQVWFQPTGGHFYQLTGVQQTGSHLTLDVSPEKGPKTMWELEARDGKLIGKQTRGTDMIALTGLPAPALKRTAPASWSKAEPIFNGKDLSGWEPIGDAAQNHWVVEDGELINRQHGANLKTTRKFTDFKLHFEVNCPDEANSGFYLRGRYELQLEYSPHDTNPPERQMGSIYGRLTPAVPVPPAPGQWETFDVTLVGRDVTIVRDGKTIVDHKQIEGITGGALDADEGEPGPFYIQGDHTGGLKFRNITVSTPQ